MIFGNTNKYLKTLKMVQQFLWHLSYMSYGVTRFVRSCFYFLHAELGYFQETAKNCMMIYNALKQPLFCSLNLALGVLKTKKKFSKPRPYSPGLWRDF